MIIKTIDIDEAKTLKDAVFIDVREEHEWADGHIDQALFCPLSILQTQRPINIPENKPCVVYCRSGQRSLAAIKILSGQGYHHLINLQGGYLAWCKYPHD